MEKNFWQKFAASMLASVALLSVATPAFAAPTRNGRLEEGEFGFYYNSAKYGYGSLFDTDTGIANLAGYRFLSSGNGKGQYVKNNAAACYNTNNYVYGIVFFNSNFTGDRDIFVPNEKRDLVYFLKNENASYGWIRV
jgi:hypothetical protein